MVSADSQAWCAFRQLKTTSTGPITAGSLLASIRTVVSSPSLIKVKPLSRIAARWAPRAMTETSIPVTRASPTASNPPMAPAPKMQTFIVVPSGKGKRLCRCGDPRASVRPMPVREI
jgi:hypothetical protein